MTDLFPIVHEEAGLLVLNKPAGLVCHPTKAGPRSSLVGRLRLYFGEALPAHLINRLDRETSGLVVAAKTPESARSLRRLWADRRVSKRYLALVEGWPESDTGRIDAPLGPDEASEIAIKDTVRPDGAPAQTRYAVLDRFERLEGRFACLQLEPVTGRKHQLRIHLRHLGHPIVGDKLYGPDERFYLDFVQNRLSAEARRRLLLPWQALHAEQLEFEWQGTLRRFEAQPEPWFQAFRRTQPESEGEL